MAASFDRSLGGDGAADGAGVLGGSLGALGSPWISRLRPPFLPTPPAAGNPAADLGGSAFHLGERPARRLGFSHRLLPRDSAAATSSAGHALLQQPGGAEPAREKGGGDVARERKEERCDMVAGFGPFQVRRSGAPLPSVEGLKRGQQKRCEWRLEGEGGGCSRGSCRPTADAFPDIGRSDHGSFAGDDGFSFLRRMAQLGVAGGGEAGEVARRDRGGKSFLVEDERWRASVPAGTGQREAVSRTGWRLQEASWFRQRGSICTSSNIAVPSDMGSEGVSRTAWRLQEASWFRQRGSLCTSSNIAAPSDMGSEGAAESSQNAKKNQWLHLHRWGGNPKVPDYHPASSSWPVSNKSITRPLVSVSCAGSRGLVGEASCDVDRRIMVSAQGAAYRGTTDEVAATGTSYDIRKSNEVTQRQVVIKSSFWNFQRVERACVDSSFNQSLFLDKRVRMKRALHPDAFVSSKSQRPRTQ